jgi:hypothetical protein
MFARGLVSLHTPPLLGRKLSSAKSRVSISSKLIEIKALQVLYFGHLRKTGGRGCYWLALSVDEGSCQFPHHQALLLATRLSAAASAEAGHSPIPTSPLFPLHTRSCLVSLLVPLHTQKQGGCPLKNVGAPTFLIFPHIFRTFSPHGHSPARRSLSGGGSTHAHHSGRRK